MARTLHKLCAVLFVGLGVVHTLFTFTFAERLTQGAVWFAGSGLAMIFAGFVNLAFGRGAAGRDRVVRLLCYLTNALLLVFGALAAVAVQEPQGYLGIALIVVMAVTAFLL